MKIDKVYKRKGFTLVEIMIVVAIIALLAAIAVPSFLRARLRAQATELKNEVRLIDAAKDQYMIDNDESFVDALEWDPTLLATYMKPGTELYNALLTLAGNRGVPTRDGGQGGIVYEDSSSLPSVVISQSMFDVVGEDFWSPYAVDATF